MIAGGRLVYLDTGRRRHLHCATMSLLNISASRVAHLAPREFLLKRSLLIGSMHRSAQTSVVTGYFEAMPAFHYAMALRWLIIAADGRDAIADSAGMRLREDYDADSGDIPARG